MKKRQKEKILNFNAVFIQEKDGGYSVSVPSLPGCFSQGDTFEESVRNIKEAIDLYLEDEKDIANNHSRNEFMVPVTVHG